MRVRNLDDSLSPVGPVCSVNLTRNKPMHPFPARMAPEIALGGLQTLEPGSTVVDPMCGSGLVLREAIQQGHKAIGFDIDPLAVLMSKVCTQSLAEAELLERGETVVKKAAALKQSGIYLPWIDEDQETSNYIDFWFDVAQRDQLRKLAFLVTTKRGPINNALKLAISRTIITKKVGASLAWDVSHSRPHKVKTDNDYDVLAGFGSAVSKIAREASQIPTDSDATVRIGNARKLGRVPDRCADAVITSPPYFNAIDYLRGHRLALVWLGYRLSKLRQIRSRSIGSEKGLSQRRFGNMAKGILKGFGFPKDLDAKTSSYLRRYILDMTQVMGEIARTLGPEGRGVLVVANSNIRGQLVDNAEIIRTIGESLGLREVECTEREIPSTRRYLPPPTPVAESSLQKRMRFESVLTFEKMA